MRLQANDSAFFPQRVTTVSGEEVTLPPFTLRKDEQVRHVLKKVLTSNELGLPATLMSENHLIRLFGLALTSAPDDLLEIGSLIMERDPSWVEDHCDTADLVELVGTFVLAPVSDNEQERVASGEVWTLARLIDFLASEYGWTVEDVLDRTRWELKAIIEAASDRYEERNRQAERQRSGRKQAVRPGRRKNLSEKQVMENVNALRAFAQSRGVYELQGGGAD